MSVISHGTVTTRKPHRCVFCEDTIPPKSVAVRCVYRDGRICVSYAHVECQAATDHAKWTEEDYEGHCDGVEFKDNELARYRAETTKENP